MPYAIDLQERDYALLVGLFDCRVMTAAHVAALYFENKREYTKKRLQKLKAAGLIGERTRRRNEPAVLFLTRKAFTLLANGGFLTGLPPLGAHALEARARVSELTLRHELEVMDVKAALHVAVSQSKNFSIVEFKTWPLLYQFRSTLSGYGNERLVKPDGYIRFHEIVESTGYDQDCFLEVDRSSETQETLIIRLAHYREHYSSGGFAVANGAERTRFNEYPFRVLVVFKTAERRNNAAFGLLGFRPSILTMPWLATLSDVTRDPLGAIWSRPSDYRDAFKGSRHDGAPSRATGYRRDMQRDHFVEQTVKKSRLLDQPADST